MKLPALPGIDALQRVAALLEKTWLRITLLLVAAFLVHLPSLQGQLIWDDNYLVGESPFFRSPIFVFEVFRHHLYLDSFSAHYRPVQNLSYMLDYLVWNGDLYGYHLSNVLWHATAGALLYLLLRRLLPPLARTVQERSRLEIGSFLVALLWVLHPVHSAAVDYISGRADSLAFAFSCGAWLVYLRAAAHPRIAARVTGYILAAILLLLGLCSREIALVWIAIFLIQLLFFGRGATRRHRILAVVVCLTVLGGYAGLRTLPGARVVQSTTATWNGVTRAGLMLRALGDYGRLTVFPTKLHMERSIVEPRMVLPDGTWRDQFAFGTLSLAGLLFGAALLVGAMKRGGGQRLRVFGAIWFALGFLPISNLVELNASSAEHWLYLPLAGLLLVFLGWMLELPPRAFRAAAATGLACAAALGVRSTMRSSDWLNAQVFYERTIAAAGWSPRVGMNLAVIYGQQGRLDEARRLLERTLAAWPDYPLARSHLATTYARLGLTDQSDRLLAKAAELAPRQRTEYPRTWAASHQLAKREFECHRHEEALHVLVAARLLEPEVWRLAELQSEILRQTRGPEAALPIVQKFADDHWWQYSAFLALGKLKAQQGDVPGALAAFRHACRLDVRETDALNFITRLEMGAENLTAALLAQERAVSRQPGEPSQYLLYSEVLLQMGRTEEAKRARETARLLEEKGRNSV